MRGDLISCLTHMAAWATSVEENPEYCAMLRQRGVDVVCEGLNRENAHRVLPTADVYYLWIGPEINFEIAKVVDDTLRDRGARARVFWPFDQEGSGGLRHLPAQLAALKSEGYGCSGTVQRVFFDETAWVEARQDECLGSGHVSYDKEFAGRHGHWGIFHMLSFEAGLNKSESETRCAGQAAQHEAHAHEVHDQTETSRNVQQQQVTDDGQVSQLQRPRRNQDAMLGPRCAAVPKFEVIDTFDIRAPMAVAERLAELAHNRSYVEIGSRHGDIFECVAHHAARAAVVEADASYCAILRERMRYVPHASVRCPAMFPKDSGTLHADVYYTWIAPAVALNLLHELRGRVRHAATFVTIVFPRSNYTATSDNPVHLWEGIHLGTLATRLTLAPFDETATMTHLPQHLQRRRVRQHVAILEFGLGEERPKWEGVRSLQSEPSGELRDALLAQN